MMAPTARVTRISAPGVLELEGAQPPLCYWATGAGVLVHYPGRTERARIIGIDGARMALDIEPPVTPLLVELEVTIPVQTWEVVDDE